MYKAVIDAPVTVTANTDVPFRKVFSTDRSVVKSGNAEKLLKPGMYEINANMLVTGATAGNVTAQIYIDKNPITATQAGITSTGESILYTVPVRDMIMIIPAPVFSFAEVSIRFSSDVTINAGVLTIDPKGGIVNA